MRKLTVKYKDGSCTVIDCDYITSADGGLIMAYDNNFIVGVFDIGSIVALYLTTKKAEGEK